MYLISTIAVYAPDSWNRVSYTAMIFHKSICVLDTVCADHMCTVLQSYFIVIPKTMYNQITKIIIFTSFFFSSSFFHRKATISKKKKLKSTCGQGYFVIIPETNYVHHITVKKNS